MKLINKIILSGALVISISGCAVTSAKQPYRNIQGDDMIISATMRGGKVKIYVNAKLAIDDSILNFDKPFSGKYENHTVTAQCKHTKHFFSVENECDVYIDNKFSANLYLR